MSVIIEQLRVSDDGKRLYINVHVNSASYFENRYLDKLIIKTGAQVSESDISPSASDGDNIYVHTFDGNQKEAALVLQPTDPEFNVAYNKTNFSQDLFFVYIICKEVTPDPCTPCPLADLTTLGVVFDDNLFYQQVMQYTSELARECAIPQGLINLILLWNAFRAAVETEHYIPAVSYYNMLMSHGVSLRTNYIKPCGCHG